MTSATKPEPQSLPPFGKADLSNCEREQIHLAGSIQPHGALLVASEPDHVIRQASANCAEFLGEDRRLIGLSLDDLGAELAARVRSLGADPLNAMPVALRCPLEPRAMTCDVMVHRPSSRDAVLECEVAGSR